MLLIKFNYESISKRLYPKECPLNQALTAMPVLVSELLARNKCFIAGGFIRRWWSNLKQDSDIDLFFINKETCDQVIAALKEKSPIVSENDFNSMFSMKINDNWTLNVQCIKLYHQTMEELFDSFDFTICQFGFNGKEIIMTEEALIDTHRKRLVPHKIRYGAASLRRAIKYTQQGYYLCAGAATEFLRQFGDFYIADREAAIGSRMISID